MEIVFDVASTDEHFEQILRLQRQNLFSTLSEEQQAREGFVFAEHTGPPGPGGGLQPRDVLLHEGCDTEPGADVCPVRAQSIQGQAPVRLPVRGRGTGLRRQGFPGTGAPLPALPRNQEPAARLSALCPEVARRNVPSLRAHLKMGFEVIGTYHDEKELWDVVAWDLQAG
jgi:hypothetical protein